MTTTRRKRARTTFIALGSPFRVEKCSNLNEFNHSTTVVVDLPVDDDVVARKVSGLLDREHGVNGASTQYQALVDDTPTHVDPHLLLQLVVFTNIQPPQHQERLTGDGRAESHQLSIQQHINLIDVSTTVSTYSTSTVVDRHRPILKRHYKRLLSSAAIHQIHSVVIIH